MKNLSYLLAAKTLAFSIALMAITQEVGSVGPTDLESVSQAKSEKTVKGLPEEELKVYKKEVELEKKEAEIELKEAEVARKEADIAKETNAGEDRLQMAFEKAEKEKREAIKAQERVRVAEKKLRVAEEKAMLALERAAIAETKTAQRRNILLRNLLLTGIILLIGYLIIFLLVGLVNRRIKDLKVKHIVRKSVVYFINVLIILYAIFVWVQDVNSITIFLGVAGAGIVLALQEAILSIAGWFLLLVRRPFEVGDRIEMGGVKGDVIDIRLFQTSLMEVGNWAGGDQSTGRIANVPNSAVFKKENFNYSRGFEFIWNEVSILVTFESDWKRAEEIMLEHGRGLAEGMEEVARREIAAMTRRYMIHYEKLTPIVYVDIKDSGVELTLRYLTEARRRRTTQDAISRAILADFGKEKRVNFAYPTYRIVKTVSDD